MKGTILDFLKLAAEKPELAKDLVDLAVKHDFEFTDDELSDFELEAVAGGADDSQLANVDMQNWLQKTQQTMQTVSLISKAMHDASTSVIRNIGS